MRKTVTGVTLGLALFMSVPAMACSSHGTAAANMINDWLGGNDVQSYDSNYNPTTNHSNGGQFGGSFTATGGESGWDDNNTDWVNFGNDSYWVTITGPDGFGITITSTTSGDTTTGTVTDSNGNYLGTVTGGGELEYFLLDTAVSIIRSYQAPDVRGADFVG
ncbi:MAG: hypothetical protein KIT58_05025 [Planctomycetota bacterium]|nr:hypothetical protein [Planctomycetota bacterium]